MKKLFIICIALISATCIVNAQNETPKYQRSSLHMILLNTDEPSLPNSDNFDKNISDAWKSYQFPDKYDQHSIDFVQGYGGKPKSSMIEIISKNQGNLSNLSVKDAQELLSNMSGKVYNQCLIDTTTIMLREQKVGQKLIMKWYNIKEDGSWSDQLIRQRSAYNASQEAVNDANSTVRGLEAISDAGEELISNTFVSFSKLSFYENEPIAAFLRDLALLLASVDPTGVATAAAHTAYEMTHLGYSAYTTNVLYQLVWNDSIKNIFYATFENGKINMEKLNAIDFPFELVGVEKVSVSTFDVKGGLANMVGSEKQKPAEDLIKQTIVRSLDKSFAQLQYSYDVFKPLMPIISELPLLVDVGMKESIKDDDKFDLLELSEDPETHKRTYKKVAVLKVVKGKVWDNRYALTEEAKAEQAQNTTKGTELAANKKAKLGMVVRQITKKKSK